MNAEQISTDEKVLTLTLASRMVVFVYRRFSTPSITDIGGTGVSGLTRGLATLPAPQGGSACLSFVCSFVLFDLFVCPHSFMFP